MDNIVKLIAFIAVLGTAVLGIPATLDLEPDNFNSVINSHEIVLTEFYAPWCRICQEVEPIVEEAATILKTKNITTARVNCDAHKELCDDHYVGIFPTFMVFKGLDNQRAYNGRREVEEFVTYMEKHALPSTTVVDKENLESFKNSRKAVVLGMFEEDDHESQANFTSIANELRDEFDFGVSLDKDLAEMEGQRQPSIILYKKFDDGRSVYSGAIKKDEIASFLTKNSIPWIDEFKPETSSHYFKNKIPLAFLVHDGSEQRDRLVEDLKPIARDNQRAVQFVTLEYSERLLTKLRFKVDKLPALLALNSDNKRYALGPNQSVNKLTVEAFVRNFKNDNLQEYWRSEPLPHQDSPVRVIVRDNFEHMVMDNEKDVLVEYYAPWCPHCKSFAPEYEKLAERYSSLSSLVTIAKADATANDFPNEVISSYPTIKLYKADDKTNPVKFEGERSIDNLAKFIAENRTRKTHKDHDEL